MTAVVLALLIVILAMFDPAPLVESLSTLAMPLPAPAAVAVKVALAVPAGLLMVASAPEMVPLTALPLNWS